MRALVPTVSVTSALKSTSAVADETATPAADVAAAAPRATPTRSTSMSKSPCWTLMTTLLPIRPVACAWFNAMEVTIGTAPNRLNASAFDSDFTRVSRRASALNPPAPVVVIVLPTPPVTAPMRTFTDPLSVTLASRSAIATTSDPPPEKVEAATSCVASASIVTEVAEIVLPSPTMADVSLSITETMLAEL